MKDDSAATRSSFVSRLAVLENAHVPSLFLISAVCGLVDSVSFLALGGVFSEMMTGNLLLLSFHIGTGQALFVDAAYLVALGSFACGAICGGRMIHHPRMRSAFGFVVEWVFLAGALVLSLVTPLGLHDPGRIGAICLLSVAMGLQNALMRKHGVPDLATNVMTLTFTALVAESPVSGGTNERWRRRAGSIAVFMLFAAFGAVLTTQVGPWLSLGLALTLFTAAVAGLTRPSEGTRAFS